MPHWLGWKNLSLVFVVSFGHLVLVASFSHSFASGKSAKSNSKNSDRVVIALRPIASKAPTDTFAKPQQPVGNAESKVTSQLSTATNEQIASPQAPYWSGLQTRDYFLDSDAVDKTAEPNETFEALLAQLLPLNIQSVVLEFWIEKDGRTVDVRCIEGACSDDVLASLPKLADLAFTPAVKNGEAVANRKVIQVDLKPNFGL